MSIKAHGITYNTMPQLLARIGELSYLNSRFGESDGRVTELDAIYAALEHYADIRATARQARTDKFSAAKSVEYLLTMTTWLMQHDAPINSLTTEMDVAVGNVALGIVFGVGRVE